MGCGRIRYTQRVIGAGDAASSDVDDETGDVHGGETTRVWERVDKTVRRLLLGNGD